jgi:hypothetical protein
LPGGEGECGRGFEAQPEPADVVGERLNLVHRGQVLLDTLAGQVLVFAEGAHAALCHAGVLGLQHDARTARTKMPYERTGHLSGQPFLSLRAGGKVHYQAGQFGQHEDAAGGQVLRSEW